MGPIIHSLCGVKAYRGQFSEKIHGEFWRVRARKPVGALGGLGVVTKAKICKRAVDRNLIRRLVKACYRQHVAQLREMDIVVSARLIINRKSRGAAREELLRLFGGFYT